MQVAEILSDLASLRVCEHQAALTLVSTTFLSTPLSTGEPSSSIATGASAVSGNRMRKSSEPDSHGPNREDPDLQRAIDLVDLHYGLKMRHIQGPDMDLQQARVDVSSVLEKLNTSKQGNAVRGLGRG